MWRTATPARRRLRFWRASAIGHRRPAREVLNVCETFYELTENLHRVPKNPAAKRKTRVLAVIPAGRRAGDIPEPMKG